MTTKLLEFIKETKIDLTKAYLVPSGGGAYLDNKFDLTPKEFLRFAKQDLKQNDDRGIINCLTNSKRAIDCLTDETLEKCGIGSNNFNPEIKNFISHFDLDDDVPIKLKIIHSLNLAPSILISKTRTLRNKLEHFYKKPSIEEAREALDIADLFIRSIEGKFSSLTNDFGLTDEKNYNDSNPFDFKNGLWFSFNQNEQNFSLTKIIDKKQAEELIINDEFMEFIGILRLMFSIDDDIELEETLKVLLKQLGHPIPTKRISLIQA